MPFGSEGEEEGIGLALSGGGFRAMLFHLGALYRLNQLGLMRSLSRVSSVSGGSLVAGRLAVAWQRLRFDDAGVATNFDAEVVRPVLRASRRHVDLPAILLGLPPVFDSANVAAWYYKRLLVGNATLQDLPDQPRFVFNATSLATASSWRFSKPYMGNYRLGLIREPRTPVAVAMAASAAFPPFLSPLTLHPRPGQYERVEGADLFDREDLRKRVALSDGGVYDNLGLETVWRRYHTVLASDAGGELSIKDSSFRFWGGQIMRIIDTATEQARALRRRVLVDDFTAGRKVGTLWRTGADISSYPAQSPFPVDPSWRFYLAAISTRLAPFKEADRHRLVNWGYLVADVAIRSWVRPDAPLPTELPFPKYDFAAPPAAGREAAADV